MCSSNYSVLFILAHIIIGNALTYNLYPLLAQSLKSKGNSDLFMAKFSFSSQRLSPHSVVNCHFNINNYISTEVQCAPSSPHHKFFCSVIVIQFLFPDKTLTGTLLASFKPQLLLKDLKALLSQSLLFHIHNFPSVLFMLIIFLKWRIC